MKVKVHWVIDGIAEVEAESLEDAEKIVNEKLSDFVSNNPDIEEKMGANAIQGKGYLPGSGSGVEGCDHNTPDGSGCCSC